MAQSCVALGSEDGWWERKPIRYAGMTSHWRMHHNWAKAKDSWFELWLSCCSMIPVTKIQTGRRRATCERSDAKAFEARYRNHPRWSSRVHGSNTPGIRANTQCCLTLPSRGRQGWRLAPSCQIKHHEGGSGDRRSIDSTIRGSWRHQTPSRTDVAGRTFVRSAVDGGLKPHSDIELLVTVTVRLDETTRRALINDLLKLRLPLEERDSPRCRSHHCCARRHHSVALSS